MLLRRVSSAPLPARLRVPPPLLTRPTPAALLATAGGDWLALALLWAAMAWGPAPLLPLWVVLAGGRLHALGVLAHEAVHLPWRREDVWRVRLLGWLCALPATTTLRAMRYHHLRHHRHSGTAADPYFRPRRARASLRAWAVVSLLPLWWSVRPWVGVLAWAVPSLRTPYARLFLQDVSGQELSAHPEVRACLAAEPAQLLLQALLLAAGLHVPRALLLGYVLPLAVMGMLNARRLLGEHTGTPAADASLAALLDTTRDQEQGLLGQLLLAPHHVGCHVVHHLHPQVHFAHLPALRRWYAEVLGARYPAALPPRLL